jgi:hypothetical protein
VKTTLSKPGLFAVFDDVLMSPQIYRAAALGLPFTDVHDGDDVFHGIAETPNQTLPDVLMSILPPGAAPVLTFFRQSPEGQVEPNFIHSDAMMGDVTAILFLTPTPPKGDGTAFWRTADTYEDHGPLDKVAMADRANWVQWELIEARFNRLLLFKSDLYHSRALEANYGHGDDARLIQVAFVRGSLPS